MILLKLDYDNINEKQLTLLWTENIQKIYRVFKYKSDQIPIIKITSLTKTKKGYHVYVEFYHNEIHKFLDDYEYTRIITLILQSFFLSDNTRTLFDMLRIIRQEKQFNLLFNYKNGVMFEENDKFKDRLNKISDEILLYTDTRVRQKD